MSRQERTPRYVFDNAGEETSTRFSALEALFDAGTFRHIEALGISPGWRCLEVGGGSGSVATWLGRRVGVDGKVVVTDIDPRFLRDLGQPRIEARKHDIVNDEIEESYYDIAHTRLVLVHLPGRKRAVQRMIRSCVREGCCCWRNSTLFR